jgi:O-antigen/teichoic acid export membrane protein
LELGGSTATIISTIVLLRTGATWYLMPFVIGYTVFILGAQGAVRAEMRGEATAVDDHDRREVVVYTALASAGTLASAGFLQATQLLAATFAAPRELAYFAAAVTLVSPMYFLPRALALALFPFLSEAHGAGNISVVRRHTDLGTRALLGVLTPFFVVGQLLAVEVVVTFGGTTYVEGAPVFQMLLLAAFVAVIQVPSVNALSSGAGLQLRTPVGWAVAGCLSGLGIVAVIGTPLGAIGVAVGYLAGTAITAAGPVIVVWRRYQMGWFGPITRSLLLVGASVALSRALDTAGPIDPQRWARDGLIAAAGCATSIAAFRRDIIGLAPFARRSRAGNGGSPQIVPASDGDVPILPIEPTSSPDREHP